MAEQNPSTYEGWHPQLLSILEAVDDTYIWALFDCPLMRKWSVGQARVQALAANNKTRLHLPNGLE